MANVLEITDFNMPSLTDIYYNGSVSDWMKTKHVYNLGDCNNLDKNLYLVGASVKSISADAEKENQNFFDKGI